MEALSITANNLPRIGSEERAHIWAFFEKLLHCVPSTPGSDYALICEAWQQVAGADWVWLWLLDEKSSAKEVVMQFGAASASSPQLHPNMLRIPDTKSVAAYCAKSGEIVDVKNIKTWRKEFGDKAYHVEFFQELKDEYKCKRVICIPLILPDSTEASIRGAICLYFRTPSVSLRYPAKVLDMMGRLAAQILLNSNHVLQRNILLRLDELAHQYLTIGGRNPSETRSKYLDEVVSVIRGHLNVDGVSIFYRDIFRGGVQCLASTGLLWGNTGERVEDLSEVNYQPNVGYTGRCFSTGLPQFLSSGMSQHEKPITVEGFDGQLGLDLPAVIYPIPLSKKIATDVKDARALGVIRCKYHHSNFYKGPALSLNALEMETLDFIACQIAPVLETMELNISRERVVSITKHDLFAPLGMIKHKVLNLRYERGPNSETQPEFVSVNRYDIYDIGRCAIISLNLVAQLEADLGFVPDAQPELLNITAQIVAPVKNMLAQYAFKANRMTIRFDGMEEFPNLWLDEDLVQRALFNLITNAIKYGQERTEILVHGRKAQRGFNIDIQNQGIGIEASEQKLIFLPGYRSPNVKHMKIGLGLGLTLARACIEKCGGSLYLLARRNPTVFSMFFPFELQKRPQGT
jgi:signal transduction histidine kinase